MNDNIKNSEPYVIGFKVVMRTEDGRLVSAIRGLTLDRCTYSDQHPTEPAKECGPLAVFSCQESAERFHRAYNLSSIPLEVWSCRYIPNAQNPNRSSSIPLWDSHGNSISWEQLPLDTILAASVQLIELVHPHTENT